jgi:hypothetical protein
MKSMRLVRGAALAALAVCLAAPLSAQQYPPQQYRAQPAPVQYAPPAQSAPLAYSGLDCSRCASGSFCVVNPLRFEYACAPTNTYACAGFSRTGFCPYGTTCWDGNCR